MRQPTTTTASRQASLARPALWLLLGTLLLYNVNLRENSSQDTMPNRIIPIALVQERTLNLDVFFRDHPAGRPLPYWVQQARGHYVSAVPILPALLAVPVYVVPLQLFGGDSWALVSFLAKLAATLIAALSVALVYLALRQLAPAPVALAIGLVYAIGTSTWSISSQGLWGHGPAELFLAAALFCVLRGEARPAFYDGVGVAAGLMVAARSTTLLVALALLAYVAHRDRRRGVRGALACGGALLPFVAYNLWTFGSIQGGYAKIITDYAAIEGFDGAWATPLAEGLLGLLVSPNRGLLVYSPILVFAFAGAALGLRGPHRRLFAYLAGGVGASLLLLAKFSWWFGGACFGPRLLTDFLPVLALFLLPAWERIERAAPLRVAAAVLFAVSVSVQIVGVFYYPSPRDVDWDTTPRDVSVVSRVWDWKDTQLLRLVRNGPRPVGFGGFE